MLIRIFLVCLVCSVNANAITLTQTVANDVLFDLASVTPTEAGTYFAKKQVGSSNATLLSINDIPNTTEWTIFAKLTTTIPGITVKIKRTGNGSGNRVPRGGRSNKELSTNDWKELFSGKGYRLDIPMQTNLFGISVRDGHGTFETDIEFKVETL